MYGTKMIVMERRQTYCGKQIRMDQNPMPKKFITAASFMTMLNDST